ncbi:MAG: hypothetical protein KAR14_04680 [Candidatus Aminicenantes bacterium]|nr:hypothetical protein [Candidatus Aminicenantes bacterium]
MKKFRILLLLIMFFSGVIWSQSINVTAPGNGVTWYKGDTHNITWTPSNCSITSYKINIFKDSISAPNFKLQLTASGTNTKSWTIPNSFDPGNYYIRVKTDDNLCVGDSGLLVIEDALPEEEPTISITNPNSGTTWRKGITYSITWDKTGQQSGGVKINIYKGSIISQPNFLEQLTSSNNGSKSWKIPENYTTGTYRLRIMTDDQVTDDSDPFMIKPKFQITPEMVIVPIHGEIEILKPTTSSFWKEGTTHLIKWKNKFTKKNTIKIDLYNYSGNTFVRTIKTILGVNVVKLYKGGGKPPDTSTYNWFIPKGLGPAKYVIKISRTDGKASGKSGMFTIQIGTKVKTYEINGSIGNYCKRSTWAVSAGNLAHLESQVGDCSAIGGGSSQGWSGYSNYAANHGKTYYGDIWRTHAYFDLKQFQGKGIILSAKLKYNKTYYPVDCNIFVYKVNAPFSDGFIVNMDLIPDPKSNMTSIAQNWMGFPNGNHGIMFVGPDESFQHNQSKSKIFLSGIKLEIELLEKE